MGEVGDVSANENFCDAAVLREGSRLDSSDFFTNSERVGVLSSPAAAAAFPELGEVDGRTRVAADDLGVCPLAPSRRVGVAGAVGVKAVSARCLMRWRKNSSIACCIALRLR